MTTNDKMVITVGSIDSFRISQTAAEIRTEKTKNHTRVKVLRYADRVIILMPQRQEEPDK